MNDVTTPADLDPVETREWLASIESVLRTEGPVPWVSWSASVSDSRNFRREFAPVAGPSCRRSWGSGARSARGAQRFPGADDRCDSERDESACGWQTLRSRELGPRRWSPCNLSWCLLLWWFAHQPDGYRQLKREHNAGISQDSDLNCPGLLRCELGDTLPQPIPQNNQEWDTTLVGWRHGAL